MGSQKIKMLDDSVVKNRYYKKHTCIWMICKFKLGLAYIIFVVDMSKVICNGWMDQIKNWIELSWVELNWRQRLEQWTQLVKLWELCSGITRDANLLILCPHRKPSLCSHNPETDKHFVTTAWWRKTLSLNTTYLTSSYMSVTGEN